MDRREEFSMVFVSLVVTLWTVTAGAALGAGVAGAVHPDDAPDMTEYADFETRFPYQTDHYPGDKNEQNGSIEYFASGADAFNQQDAEEGVFIDWIIVHAKYDGEEWINYSACGTSNTKAFGIDRGNNNSGTNYDEDLVQKQEQVWFRDDGIVIDFFEWDDFSNDPPYMAPEDAIVAAQGAGSTDGPCLTLTDKPGWYRIAGFMNGTVADNGRNEQPSENAERVSLELNANFMYVCMCESRQEAEEKLGPPPGQTPTPTETPTGTDNPTDTPTPTGDPTETPQGTADPTDTPGGDTPTSTPNDDGPTQTQDNGGGGVGTPTAGEGPGFGPLVALLALLATALLVNRRR